MLKIKFALLICYFSAISPGDAVEYSLKEVQSNRFCYAENTALIPGAIKPGEDSKQGQIEIKDKKDITDLLTPSDLGQIGEYAKAVIEVLVVFGLKVAASVVPILGLVSLILSAFGDDKYEEKFKEIDDKFKKLAIGINDNFLALRQEVTLSTSTLERSILFGEINQMLAFQENCKQEEKTAYKEECLRNAERYIESALKKFAIYYKEVHENSKLTDEQLDRIKLNIFSLTEYVERLYLPIKLKKLVEQIAKGNNDKEKKDIYTAFAKDITSIYDYMSNAGEMITENAKSDNDQRLEISYITFQFQSKNTPNIQEKLALSRSKMNTLTCEARFDRRLVDKCEVAYKIVHKEVKDTFLSGKNKNPAEYNKFNKKDSELLKSGGWSDYEADSWEELCGFAMEGMYNKYNGDIGKELQKQWDDISKQSVLLQILKKMADEGTFDVIEKIVKKKKGNSGNKRSFKKRITKQAITA